MNNKQVNMPKFHYFVITCIAFAGLSLSGCKDKNKEKKDMATQTQETGEEPHQQEVKEEVQKEEQEKNKLPERWRNKDCLQTRQLKIVGGTNACWESWNHLEINNVPQEGCVEGWSDDEYMDVRIENVDGKGHMSKKMRFFWVSKYGGLANGTGDWKYLEIEKWLPYYKLDGDHIVLKGNDLCFILRKEGEENPINPEEAPTHDGYVTFAYTNMLLEVKDLLNPGEYNPCFRGDIPSVEHCYDDGPNENFNPSDICDIFNTHYVGNVYKLIDDILQGNIVVKNADEVISYVNGYFIDTIKEIDKFYRKNKCQGLFKNDQQLDEVIKILNSKEGDSGYKMGTNWDNLSCRPAHRHNIAILRKYAYLFKNDN